MNQSILVIELPFYTTKNKFRDTVVDITAHCCQCHFLSHVRLVDRYQVYTTYTGLALVILGLVK